MTEQPTFGPRSNPSTMRCTRFATTQLIAPRSPCLTCGSSTTICGRNGLQLNMVRSTPMTRSTPRSRGTATSQKLLQRVWCRGPLTWPCRRLIGLPGDPKQNQESDEQYRQEFEDSV